jgi:hypothetical protein
VHVARMTEKRNAYRVLVQKREEDNLVELEVDGSMKLRSVLTFKNRASYI